MEEQEKSIWIPLDGYLGAGHAILGWSCTLRKPGNWGYPEQNSSMTEVEKEIEGVLSPGGIFTVKSITNVNHKPHPYMVGPQHIKHASDKHMGRLGEETMRAVRCAHPNCHVEYDDHKSDKVLFVQLKRNASNDEASDELKKLLEIFQNNGIDGVAFVETPEGYRINK